MPLEGGNPTKPAEWLRRARSNLFRAKIVPAIPDVLYEDSCFDAQQAAEKAIKALLVHLAVQFPRTHSIVDLLTLVDQSGLSVPSEVRAAGILAAYAVESRYPGLCEGVTREDYFKAIELAESVVAWAERTIESSADDK